MKKYYIIYICFALLLGMTFSFNRVMSQSEDLVDYGDQPVVDSDLDGLTDQGEKVIFKTDPTNPDSDKDGFFDGAEILSGTNPLKIDAQINPAPQEPQVEKPWAWYISRSSGFVAFFMLYLSILFGLGIRTPYMKKLVSPLQRLNGHCLFSLQAIIISFVHAVALLFDRFINFSLADIAIPFFSEYKKIYVAFGIIGFYLMLVITISTFLRKYISQKLWRIIHSFNAVLYVGILVHVWVLGTDMKNIVIKNIFILANAFLLWLMIIHISFRVIDWIKKKKLEKMNIYSL